ncbi:UNVERIFIED_CONTAM: hypothetical protein K2H54_062227 [Gekko kuhli]
MDSCSMWDEPQGPQKRGQRLECDSLPSDSEGEIEKASVSEPRSLPPRDDLGDVNRSSVLSETNMPYAELLIRMAKALHLEYLATEPQTKDPLMKVLFDPEAGPVALPFLPGIQEVIASAWEQPASVPASSRKLENLYRVKDTDCAFLFQHPKANSMMAELYDLFPWIMKHVPGAHKRAIAARNFVADFALKEVQKHRVHQVLYEPLDFIDYYLLQMEKCRRDPTSTYNEETLVQCIADLFAAGTDSTTNTLHWAFLLMANYPDVQEKVQKEIDNVFGYSQLYSYQDRRNVPYTNAVIHEIQRSRYILLFGIPRRCSKDVNVFGFFIPKGATVITDLRSVLLDPKKWETPEKFNPNHFLDKDGHFVENEAFLPFGAGARVCVGEQLASTELFILFTRMLREFTLQPPEGVKKISEETIVRFTTTPHPYKICAIPRNKGL